MLNESSDWKKEFMVFANYYYEDVPNFNGLDAELISGSVFGIVQNLKTTCLILFL